MDKIAKFPLVKSPINGNIMFCVFDVSKLGIDLTEDLMAVAVNEFRDELKRLNIYARKNTARV